MPAALGRDLFGRTAERKMERELVVEYKASIEGLLKSLTADNHAVAVEIARVPEMIKGYGHVKERNVKAARLQWAGLAQRFAEPAAVGEKRAA